ncbi:GNAT family N-acetyltransferase [bacterium]|nr:GNAT family N-acetyltransferase [bacterium]
MSVGLIVDLVPEMFEQEAAGFLADIYVAEAYRTQGVGRNLVAALADWFRSRGVRHLELYVASHNLAGRSFWEAVGGQEIMRQVRVEL